MTEIAFDARLAGHPGIGRYIRSLLAAMLDQDPAYSFRLIGPAEVLEPFKQRAFIVPCDVPIYGLKEQLEMPAFFRGANLVHVPHFNAPWHVGAPLVTTVHDLIYFYVPEYEPFPGARLVLRMQMAHLMAQAARVITVSDATRKDVEKSFPAARGKTRVTHEAADPYFTQEGAVPDVRAKFGLTRPYALFVGSIREHKNVQGLLAAYEKLSVSSPGLADLVLVGKLDARFDRKHRFGERVKALPGIRHLTGVGDVELKGLYREAACLVQPSFYEGFGLPVLEAMSCGTPVLASDRTSLPEVAGGAALLFDPGQIDRIAELLYNVLSSASLRLELSSKGLERSREFSWTKTARETLAVYGEALANRG